MMATLDLSITAEVPITEQNSSVATIQPLINPEEEPVAIDTEEEPEVVANSFTV